MGEEIKKLRGRLVRCLENAIGKDIFDTILFGFDRACGLASEKGRQTGLKIAIDRLVEQKEAGIEIDIKQEIIALQEHMYEEECEDPETTDIKAQIAHMDARTAALESGDGLISIGGDSLYPELDELFYKIMEKFQIRVAKMQSELMPEILGLDQIPDSAEKAAASDHTPDVDDPDKVKIEIGKRYWLKPGEIITLKGAGSRESRETKLLKKAIYNTIHNHPTLSVAAIADKINMAGSYLYRAALPDQDTDGDDASGVRFPLKKLLPLMRATGDYQILECIEHNLGRLYIPVSLTGCTVNDLPATTAKVVEAFSQLLMKYSTIMTARKISKDEAEIFNKIASTSIREIAVFDRAVQMMVEPGIGSD